jgi:hypothetical protein
MRCKRKKLLRAHLVKSNKNNNKKKVKKMIKNQFKKIKKDKPNKFLKPDLIFKKCIS